MFEVVVSPLADDQRKKSLTKLVQDVARFFIKKNLASNDEKDDKC